MASWPSVSMASVVVLVPVIVPSAWMAMLVVVEVGDGDGDQRARRIRHGGDHAHEHVAVGVQKVSARVKGQGAEPGEAGDARGVLNGEVALAGDVDVQRAGGLLEGAAGVDHVDGAHQRAVADLGGVVAAGGGGGGGSARQRLVVQVREDDPAGLEAGRVDVGNVVADDVQHGLMPLQARNRRKQGSNHE
jgi:hypothetical protein